MRGEKVDILEAHQLIGEQKAKERALDFVERLYNKVGCNLIHFENVTAFDYLAQDLKKRGLAVQTFTPSKDKVTRLREIESFIQDGTI